MYTSSKSGASLKRYAAQVTNDEYLTWIQLKSNRCPLLPVGRSIPRTSRFCGKDKKFAEPFRCHSQPNELRIQLGNTKLVFSSNIRQFNNARANLTANAMD